METLFLDKRTFNSLQPLEIDKSIINSEGELFKFSEKIKWQKELKILKRLKVFEGNTFNNKIATLMSLISNREELSVLDIVIPEKLVIIDKKLSAFTMPYIEGTNLKQILDNPSIDPIKKVGYFKQIGKLFESLHNFRKYSSINDLYLGDVREGNFMVERKSDKVYAVDIDSCKINGNKPFRTKYLNWLYIQKNLEKKYLPYDFEREIYEVDENSDIFCYCVMLLNFFYGESFYKLSLSEYYNYLQYLEDLKFPKKLIEIFSNLYTLVPNENPYEYLDELPYDFMKANKKVYKRIKK